MNLQDIFDQLTYGELANISLGGSEEGGITLVNTPKVISHINMAIQALHIKFMLEEAEYVIPLIEGVTMYEISVSQITGVFNELGEKVSFNDPTDLNSVFTPRWDILQVPITVEAVTLYLAYIPKPVKVALDAIVADIEIDLPEVLLEPLLAYTASRIYTSIGNPEAIQEAMVQMSRFNLLCLNIKSAGILNITEQATNLNLENRGWL